MWCILKRGTVPLWCILNKGTVPTFNSTHLQKFQVHSPEWCSLLILSKLYENDHDDIYIFDARRVLPQRLHTSSLPNLFFPRRIERNSTSPLAQYVLFLGTQTPGSWPGGTSIQIWEIRAILGSKCFQIALIYQNVHFNSWNLKYVMWSNFEISSTCHHYLGMF